MRGSRFLEPISEVVQWAPDFLSELCELRKSQSPGNLPPIPERLPEADQPRAGEGKIGVPQPEISAKPADPAPSATFEMGSNHFQLDWRRIKKSLNDG
jgi:hypothetical protein